MPSNVVKGIAQKTGKSEVEVEKLWEDAKAVTKKEYPEVDESSDQFFKITTGILKKMTGLKENFLDLIDSEIKNLSELSEAMHKDKKEKSEDEDESDEDEEDEKTKKKMKKDDSEDEVDKEKEKE